MIRLPRPRSRRALRRDDPHAADQYARVWAWPRYRVTAAIQRGNHDLRDVQGYSLMTPIRDQGQVGACTGFAWARMRAAASARYHIERGEAPDLGDDISARFIYDVERSMTGQYPNDVGASMRDGGEVLNKYGVCPERYLPYTGKADNGPIATGIPPEAYAAALSYGVSTFYRLSGTGMNLINSILGCLDEGWACVIAILVPPSFTQIAPQGRVPTPQTGEAVLGGHAMTVCGNFIDGSFDGGGCLLVANSWAESFGEDGYCYLPFSWSTTARAGTAPGYRKPGRSARRRHRAARRGLAAGGRLGRHSRPAQSAGAGV
jgi:hypothetical protein